MPNPIYLQQKANPWEAMLPQLLGNLFLAKVKHGWDMESAAKETEQKVKMSGKFTEVKPTVEEGEPEPQPTFRLGETPYYRIPTTITPATIGGHDIAVTTGPEGSEFKFMPKKEGWKPATKEEAMEVRAAGKTDSGPTLSKIEGNVFSKWVTDSPLNKKEQMLVDRKFKETGQSPDEVKANAKARIAAKVETFKDLMKREPSSDELRSMIVNDPYGILAPSGGGGGLDKQYTHIATNSKGEKMGSSDGVNWVPIK